MRPLMWFVWIEFVVVIYNYGRTLWSIFLVPSVVPTLHCCTTEMKYILIGPRCCPWDNSSTQSKKKKCIYCIKGVKVISCTDQTFANYWCAKQWKKKCGHIPTIKLDDPCSPCSLFSVLFSNVLSCKPSSFSREHEWLNRFSAPG